VIDGQEVNGTWCFKGEAGCTPSVTVNASRPLLPLNPDTDADGLRDGQEIAGWMVGIWYERTMESAGNYSVTSDPKVNDTDGDTLTDFSEFMNGSDPRKFDTDGDGITDPQEIARGSNITGIEGTPPEITNVQLNVGIDWSWWGFLYLPMNSHVTVDFDIKDNVGIDFVKVTFIRVTGSEARVTHFSTDPAHYMVSTHISERFDFSIFEALATGADVNITTYDVNQNGAWGNFHVKSVLEAIVAAIAAFLSAIAKVIMEAVSAAISWIWGMMSALVSAVTAPIVRAIGDFLTLVATKGLARALLDVDGMGVAAYIESALSSLLRTVLEVLGWVIVAICVILAIITGVFSFIIAGVVGFIISLAIGALMGSHGDDTPKDDAPGSDRSGGLGGWLTSILNLPPISGWLSPPPVTRSGIGFDVIVFLAKIAKVLLGSAVLLYLIKLGEGWGRTAIGLLLSILGLVLTMAKGFQASIPGGYFSTPTGIILALGIFFGILGIYLSITAPPNPVIPSWVQRLSLVLSLFTVLWGSFELIQWIFAPRPAPAGGGGDGPTQGQSEGPLDPNFAISLSVNRISNIAGKWDYVAATGMQTTEPDPYLVVIFGGQSSTSGFVDDTRSYPFDFASAPIGNQWSKNYVPVEIQVWDQDNVGTQAQNILDDPHNPGGAELIPIGKEGSQTIKLLYALFNQRLYWDTNGDSVLTCDEAVSTNEVTGTNNLFLVQPQGSPGSFSLELQFNIDGKMKPNSSQC
jgi:hypothetical protein